MTHKVRVEVASEGSIVDTLLGFKATVDKWVHRVPAEYRNDAHVEITTGGSYENSWTELVVYYYRKLTAEEAEAAARKERLIREAREAQDWATYQHLRAKFEKPDDNHG